MKEIDLETADLIFDESLVETVEIKEVHKNLISVSVGLNSGRIELRIWVNGYGDLVKEFTTDIEKLPLTFEQQIKELTPEQKVQVQNYLRTLSS